MSLERQKNRLGHYQGCVHVTSKKLIAYGILLARQGTENEGFTELEGLGTELEEIGYRLGRIAHGLDLVNIALRRFQNTENS